LNGLNICLNHSLSTEEGSVSKAIGNFLSLVIQAAVVKKIGENAYRSAFHLGRAIKIFAKATSEAQLESALNLARKLTSAREKLKLFLTPKLIRKRAWRI